MKKEEILEVSRRENKKKDMYMCEVDYKACRAGAIAMSILAFIFYLYELISGKGSNPAIYSLITMFCSILYGYKSIYITKNKKLNMFTSIIWGILTIFLLLEYFKVI